MSTLVDDMALVVELAEEADSLTMQRFGAVDLRIETKPDMTPGDRCRSRRRDDVAGRLAERRPGDSVLGEEFGGTTEFSGRQWVIDPIDGTKNFVRGVPVWATLIALLVDGVPGRRRGERPRPGTTVVGGAGSGCVHARSAV